MRIVSLNAWGGRLWDDLRPWVQGLGADVLCLQEVTRALEPSPPWLIFRDAGFHLDQRADLYAEISALLPAHRAQFCAAARGRLSDASGQGYASEHGIAVWIAPDLALTEQIQRFAHGAFGVDGWGTHPVPRSLHGLRLYDPASGRFVVLVHLHGLRDVAGKQDTPARTAQANAICALIADLRQPGDGAVVAGDLNLLPDSATFAALSGIGLTDLVTGQGHTDTRTSQYGKPCRYADYMLVSPEVRVRRFAVPALPEVSDHRPLVLDFDLT